MRQAKKNSKNDIDRPCDHSGCPEKGLYRAPKDRTLSSYYWFCLKHVKEYNKNWNFYAGLSIEEVEQHNQNDITWQRPTWRLGTRSTVSSKHIKDPMGMFHEVGLGMDGKHHPPVKPLEKYERKFREAVLFLELEVPVKKADLKRQYKKMAKKYHPDTNKGSKEAEKMFKKLAEAYHYLMERIGG